LIAHYSLPRCNTTSYGRHALMLHSTLLPGITMTEAAVSSKMSVHIYQIM